MLKKRREIPFANTLCGQKKYIEKIIEKLLVIYIKLKQIKICREQIFLSVL